MMSATNVAGEVTGNSIVQILEEKLQTRGMVTTHEEAMHSVVTLVQVPLTRDPIMKVTVCLIMMLTRRGATMAIKQGLQVRNITTNIPMCLAILVDQVVI